MIKHLSIFILTLSFSSLFAQTTFSKMSFEKAQELSKKDNRILMVQLSSKDCIQCNEVAEKGLGSTAVNDKISAEKIIAIQFGFGEDDWDQLTKKYNAPGGLVILFFSPSGNMIYRYNGSTTFSNSYVQMIDAAKSKLNDEAAIETFEKAYASGSRNPALLSQLIDFRQNLGRETGPVLDDYVRSLPADSLQSIMQLQKIARYAPELMTYADTILRSNGDRFNEAWYRMDLQTRININNRIIAKTRKKAVEEKNKKLATLVATFAAGVTNNSMDKMRAYNFNMMEYGRQTQDTTIYFRYALNLYDLYYMQISADSIKRMDSLNKQQAFSTPAILPNVTDSENSGRIGVQRTTSFTPKAQFFANDLNHGAFTMYMMNPPDKYISSALKWSARSLEFNESAASLDTYARLLYKNGQRDSAIYYQQKAVELQKKNGYKAVEFETVLKKMKNKDKRIDEYCCDY
jgi:thioredoxin-related protein